MVRVSLRESTVQSSPGLHGLSQMASRAGSGCIKFGGTQKCLHRCAGTGSSMLAFNIIKIEGPCVEPIHLHSTATEATTVSAPLPYPMPLWVHLQELLSSPPCVHSSPTCVSFPLPVPTSHWVTTLPSPRPPISVKLLLCFLDSRSPQSTFISLAQRGKQGHTSCSCCSFSFLPPIPSRQDRWSDIVYIA